MEIATRVSCFGRRAAANLDTSDVVARRARRAAGDDDAEMLEVLEGTLARTATVIAAKVDSRTRAAALHTAGLAHLARAAMQGVPGDAAQGRAELLEAARLWPALDVARSVVASLIDEAALSADPARWSQDRRVRSAIALLAQLVAQADPLADAVRASPRWAEVLAFATADASPSDLDDLRLARLLDDAALLARTTAVPTDPILRMDLEAEALLRPGADSFAEDQALLAAP